MEQLISSEYNNNWLIQFNYTKDLKRPINYCYSADYDGIKPVAVAIFRAHRHQDRAFAPVYLAHAKMLTNIQFWAVDVDRQTCSQ
jgi:hypothetical protein